MLNTIYENGCFPYMYVRAPHACSVHRGWKRASDPLGLELQTLSRSHGGCWESNPKRLEVYTLACVSLCASYLCRRPRKPKEGIIFEKHLTAEPCLQAQRSIFERMDEETNVFTGTELYTTWKGLYSTCVVS